MKEHIKQTPERGREREGGKERGERGEEENSVEFRLKQKIQKWSLLIASMKCTGPFS